MKKTIASLLCLISVLVSRSQVLRLDSVLQSIQHQHPELRMYDAQAKALVSYAKGAKSWEAPQVSAGLWMTPYNAKLWKPDANSMISPIGLGQFMVSGVQMIPNFKRQNANQKYMRQMAFVENAKKGAAQNQLFTEAKTSYFEWLVLKKKLVVLKESEVLLQFMVKVTENRYPLNQENWGVFTRQKLPCRLSTTTGLCWRTKSHKKWWSSIPC